MDQVERINQDKIQNRINRAFKVLGRARLRETDTLRVRAMLMYDLARRASRYQSKRAFSVDWSRCFCVFRPGLTVAVVAALVFVLGGSVTVVAAQTVIPGHPFYGMKLASEKVASAVIPGNVLGLEVASKIAARRAEELILLKVRSAALGISPEQQAIARDFSETARRLSRSVAQVQHRVGLIKLEPGDGGRLQKIEQDVKVVAQALAVMKKDRAQDDKIAQTADAAREIMETLEKSIRESTDKTSSATPGEGALNPQRMDDLSRTPATLESVEAVFEEIAEVEKFIAKTKADLKTQGVSLTVGIEADLKVLRILRAEAEEYLNIHKYEEAQGLAQAAQRLGHKILRVMEWKRKNGGAVQF